MPYFRVCSLRPCYQRLWLDMRLGFCVLGRFAETALNMVVDKPGSQIFALVCYHIGPKNLNPRLFMSLLMASDSGETAGI